MKNLEENLQELVNNEKLKWLPWVGYKYNNSSKKMLIVGESHYYDPTKQSSIDNHNKIDYTRICIKDIGIKKEYKNYDNKRTARLFPNFHKTVFGNDNSDSSPLWENVAYYNFVQVPMHSNKSRPSAEEIYTGWSSFFEVINVMQPDCVLFIGSEALNKFKVYAKRNSIEHSNFSYHKISNNQISRHFEISSSGKTITIDSIKHCSSHFSIDKWHEYLKSIKMFDFI